MEGQICQVRKLARDCPNSKKLGMEAKDPNKGTRPVPTQEEGAPGVSGAVVSLPQQAEASEEAKSEKEPSLEQNQDDKL